MREKFCKDNWKQTDINVDSLWLIQERDKSGNTKMYTTAISFHKYRIS